MLLKWEGSSASSVPSPSPSPQPVSADSSMLEDDKNWQQVTSPKLKKKQSPSHAPTAIDISRRFSSPKGKYNTDNVQALSSNSLGSFSLDQFVRTTKGKPSPEPEKKPEPRKWSVEKSPSIESVHLTDIIAEEVVVKETRKQVVGGSATGQRRRSRATQVR